MAPPRRTGGRRLWAVFSEKCGLPVQARISSAHSTCRPCEAIMGGSLQKRCPASLVQIIVATRRRRRLYNSSDLSTPSSGDRAFAAPMWREDRDVMRVLLKRNCVGIWLIVASVIVAGIVTLTSTTARAATYSWQASSGDWSSSVNWSGSIVPTSSDTAYVANGGAASITQSGETCTTLLLGGSLGGSVQMFAGGLTRMLSALARTAPADSSRLEGAAPLRAICSWAVRGPIAAATASLEVVS